MAGNSMNQWSWSEIMARYNKAGDQLLDEVNVLVQTNDILQDAPVRESTEINGEEFDVTTTLPQPYLLSRGEGRAATKGQVTHGSESVAWMGNQLRINKEFLASQPRPQEFLKREEGKHYEAMWQAYAEMLFYGNSGDQPQEFDGLDIRYDTIATDSVIDNGGSTASNMTDIWLIQWDQYDCCMIYPKGEAGGIGRTPMPDVALATQTDSDNAVPDSQKKLADFMRVNFDWKGGLCLRDPRRVKRIANIHQTPGNANAFKINAFYEAEEAFDTPGQIYAYMNKRIRLQIRREVNEKANVFFPPNQPFAKPVPYLGEIPLRRCDRILLTGNQIS